MPRNKLQNHLTSAELLAQVLPENKQLLNDFGNYLNSINRSPLTISGYKNDIEIFFCWNLQFNGNKLFTNVRKRDIINFQNWLKDVNKNSPARISRIKAALSSFSNFIFNICEDDYPNYIPIVRKIETPLITPTYEKTVLTTEDVDLIFNTLKEQEKYQLACLFALAISCGARKSELIRFKVDFFKPENLIYGTLYKTPPIKTKGRGGGKYISKYVLANIFQPWFDLWIQEREEKGINSEFLFVCGKDYHPANEETITGWTNNITNIINKPFYWHCTRHYWTSYLLTSGLPETVVTDLSGWASADMVSVYDDRDKDEVFSKYFKDGQIIAPDQTI